MADAKDNDASATGAKTGTGSGAVKPPVLEGTARPAAAADEKPAANKAEPLSRPDTAPKEQPDLKPARDGQSSAAEQTGASPWLAGIAGGVLGLGAAYALAFFGLWPAPATVAPPADPRIAQSAAATAELQQTADSLRGDLSALGQRLGELENSVSAMGTASDTAPPPENATFAADIAALSDRLDALAAAPGTDIAASDENTQSIETLRIQLGEMEQLLAGLREDVSAIDQSVRSDADRDAGQLRLPIVLSSLESAFAAGRPYAAELEALRRAMPSLEVPALIASEAEEGLVSPDEVMRRFNQVLPDMMSGRPAAAGAEWQDAAADWFRGLIAMRPSGDVDGDSPDAIIARLEYALERRDFVEARAELQALPAPMQSAAGSVSRDIALLADASAFLSAVRSAALGSESGQ